MLINTKECIYKKYSPNKCKQFWMSSCYSIKRSCSHWKYYHKNSSLTFSPGTGCALGSQTWPAGCQKLEDIKEEGTFCTHPVSHRYPLLATSERRWSCMDLCYGLEQLLLYPYVKWKVWESRSNLESERKVKPQRYTTWEPTSQVPDKGLKHQNEQKNLRRYHKETLD